MSTTPGTVYFNHGKESGPWGSKIKKLAKVAEQKGFAVESPNYRDLPDADPRVERLLGRWLREFDELLQANPKPDLAKYLNEYGRVGQWN
jgi:hypothetical protein